MQIKIRKYVYRIYRPVVGAWLSGTKRELLSKALRAGMGRGASRRGTPGALFGIFLGRYFCA